MAVTALPTPPSRSDPATFAARGDAFMSALPTFQAEINALQITTNAQTAADAAASATSAAEAVVAKNAAIAAWVASMSPAETLPALSQSLHIGAVVKAIVYDTSKDSDGGAWRKRCADKSWYTETLGGDRWIGQHATIAAAWTAAGSTTGAVYQASATAGAQTSGLYYTPTSSTTVTQVYRGVTREFPAVAGIVAESARVVIYDLATGAMWRVHVQTALASATDWWRSGRSATGLAAVNGKVSVSITTSLGGVIIADYAADKAIRHSTTASGFVAPLTLVSSVGVSGALSNIVSESANDVAITVLDTAPIDPATGLPVPTIAVATAGGVSVIKDDGTVRNSLSTTASYGLSFDDLKRVVWNTTTEINRSPVPPLAASFTASVAATDIKLSSSAYSTSNVSLMPAVTSAGGMTAKNAVASSAGLTVYKAGQTAPSVMLAAITTAYNSGQMVGDIRGAYLADTTAETVTASGELVTNGTFSSDTNWTDYLNGSTGGSVVITGSAMVITQGSDSVDMGGGQGITTVVGKTYTATVTNTTAVNARLRIGGSLGSSSKIESASFQSSSQSTTFVATATTTYITPISVGAATSVVNITLASVKLAEPDRSVKNKGLVINGSLTKTAVTSGAGLVAWSGFSAANYLEQPYNSDLDFGTGDFSIVLWHKQAAIGTLEYLYSRDSSTPGKAIRLWVNTSGYLVFELYDGTTTRTATGATSVGTAAFNHIVCTYTAGTLTIYLNGVSYATATGAALLTMTNATAIARIGYSVAGASPATNASLSLLRASATLVSTDQIAHIYRTELPLFQASAQCTIAGSSTAVTALAFDDTSELLHVGTSWGRTGFKDLLRVDSEATTTGALTSLSASQGVIITGGTSGKVYVPAMLLRDELRRKDEARKALGKVPVFFDYTATASQTAFVAPKGYAIKAVYHNGTLKRETTTGVYWTRSTDGFAETCTLSAGATVSDWISLMCVRT